jgi:hypothetical protein
LVFAYYNYTTLAALLAPHFILETKKVLLRS